MYFYCLHNGHHIWRHLIAEETKLCMMLPSWTQNTENPHVHDTRNNEEKVTNLDFPQTFLIVVLPLSSIRKNASKNKTKTTAKMPNFHK